MPMDCAAVNWKLIGRKTANLSRLLVFSAALGSGVAIAGNGINAGKIPYKAFPDGRPRSVTIITGQVGKNLRLLGSVLPNGVAWEDLKDLPQEAFRQQICQLANEPCQTYKPRGVGIGELYLGTPDGLHLPLIGTPAVIGVDSLVEVGFGAKRVLLLSVEDMSHVMQSITIVFDDGITDDQLRQIALEDGVYRVLRYRDEE